MRRILNKGLEKNLRKGKYETPFALSQDDNMNFPHCILSEEFFLSLCIISRFKCFKCFT